MNSDISRLKVKFSSLAMFPSSFGFPSKWWYFQVLFLSYVSEFTMSENLVNKLIGIWTKMRSPDAAEMKIFIKVFRMRNLCILNNSISSFKTQLISVFICCEYYFHTGAFGNEFFALCCFQKIFRPVQYPFSGWNLTGLNRIYRLYVDTYISKLCFQSIIFVFNYW